MATVRIQLRRGTADQWYDANPILAAGEVGLETDTNTFKFGDGATNWNDLSYALSDTVDDYIPLTEKGEALGVATLDSDGYVPAAQLPPLAKITVNAVADQSARLALTAEPGDIAIQSDNGTTYVLESEPASTNGNWREISATAAISAAVSAHESDTTNVHGIADTSLLATTAYADQAEADAIATAAADATTKANAAQAAAESSASSNLTVHIDKTTNVHGISDTSLLATMAYADQAEADAKTYADGLISNLVGAAPEALNTLQEIAASLNDDADLAGTLTAEIATKVTLTEAREGLSGGGGINYDSATGIIAVNNTIATRTYVDDAETSANNYTDSSISTVTSNAAATYAPIESPTFTGTVGLPLNTSIGDVTSTEIGYLSGVTSTVQGQLDDKLDSANAAETYAPLESPTFTGTVGLPLNTSIGSVTSTEIGYLSGVTSTVQGQLDDKLDSANAAATYAPLESAIFTGTISLPANTSIGDVEAQELAYLNGVTSAIQGQIDAKAPLESPTFTGTVVLPNSTVTSAMIAANTVATSNIADTAITSDKIASSAVTTEKINDGAVTSAKIADGTIVNADINASAEIAQSKIANLTTDLAAKALDADLDSHTGATTSVHGIADTSVLVTLNGLQTLTGKTLSAADNTITINAADIVDVTATAAELNILDGVTATAAELNILDGVTASTAELNYVDGVTSAIQTQLDAKALDADLDAHTGSSTSVHGISDTAQLAYLNAANQTFTGNMEVDGDMTVDGNLTVNGTTFNASSTSIVIEDNMVQLAHQNAANSVDLGLVVAYNDGTAKHSGIVRDVSADKWKLFKGVTTEPSTTVDFTQGSLDDLEVAGLTASSLTVGSVSNTEIGYLDGVTSAIQTQIDTKAPTASPTFTGTVVLPSTTSVGNVSSTELGYLDGVTSAIQTQINTKAPTASPTFTGTVTVAASGIAYTDGTQTKEGVPSRTYIYGATNSNAITADATLSTLAYRDSLIEVNSSNAVTLTIPPNSTTAFPIGASWDIVRMGSGAVTIAPGSGVTLNYTPGNKLRAQYSSGTLFKRGTDSWLLIGDLTA